MIGVVCYLWLVYFGKRVVYMDKQAFKKDVDKTFKEVGF
jgi:hypothetical protein